MFSSDFHLSWDCRLSFTTQSPSRYWNSITTTHLHITPSLILLPSFRETQLRLPSSSIIPRPCPRGAAPRLPGMHPPPNPNHPPPSKPAAPRGSSAPLPLLLSYFSGGLTVSPRMRRTSCMSLGMMVTRLVWRVTRLVSSKSPMSWASAASCKAARADPWNLRSLLVRSDKNWVTSLVKRWKGSLRRSNSVDFWYLRISRRATVPGRKRWGFFTPPRRTFLADRRASLVAS
jgi:hypothetical protein